MLCFSCHEMYWSPHLVQDKRLLAHAFYFFSSWWVSIVQALCVTGSRRKDWHVLHLQLHIKVLVNILISIITCYRSKQKQYLLVVIVEFLVRTPNLHRPVI